MTDRQNHRLARQGSSSGSFVISATSTPSSRSPTIHVGSYRTRRRGHPTSGADIEAAVYAYMRAMRALGRTTLNTLEIADALEIPLHEVETAISKLSDKGIKAVG